MKQRVYIETFGCQMNVRDSEETKGLLLKRDFVLTDDVNDAQVILLNTCSVRQHAEERIFGRTGRLAKIKKQKPETVIGIMGCMAQGYGKKFFSAYAYLGPRVWAGEYVGDSGSD